MRIPDLKQKKKAFIDNTARRPKGKFAVKQYADPKAHYRSFDLILKALDLKEGDIYCEVGCGGGVLLNMAMEKAGRGAAIDHSPEMVALSLEKNRAAVEAGRLEVVQGDAQALPWDTGRFTACACANMFFFVARPELALAQMHRVLAPGGRLSLVTAGDRMLTKITLGRLYELKLYSDREMAAMLEAAGFCSIRVKTGITGFIQACYAEK